MILLQKENEMRTTDHDDQGNDLVCACCKLDIERWQPKVLFTDGFHKEYAHEGDCAYSIHRKIDKENQLRETCF